MFAPAIKLREFDCAYLVHVDSNSLSCCTNLFGSKKYVKARPASQVYNCLALYAIQLPFLYLIHRVNKTYLSQSSNREWIAAAQSEVRVLWG
jgi:hypothetical protein